jgi:hypothetical protein
MPEKSAQADSSAAAAAATAAAANRAARGAHLLGIAS